jgi:tetratricopeptide (TPR) repeat protein
MSTQQVNHATGDWLTPEQQELEELEPEVTPPVAAALLPLADEVAAACQRYQQLFDQRMLAYTQQDAPSSAAEGGAAPLPLGEPLADLQLVRRLQQAMAAQPEQLAAIEAHCNWTLFDWLSERIFGAAEQGQLDTALALFDDWEKLTRNQTEDLVGTRERLLLCGGRTEEAKAAVLARLLREPESLDALESAAFIYQKCGELEPAEKYARRYLAVARQSGDSTDEICALQTLAELLHERGDHDAALELEQQASDLPIGDFDDEDETD